MCDQTRTSAAQIKAKTPPAASRARLEQELKRCAEVHKDVQKQ